MSEVEFCRDGIFVRFFVKKGRSFLEIAEYEEMDPPSAEIRTDHLASVVRGITYQISLPRVVCELRRHGRFVEVEIVRGSATRACRVRLDEFVQALDEVYGVAPPLAYAA